MIPEVRRMVPEVRRMIPEGRRMIPEVRNIWRIEKASNTSSHFRNEDRLDAFFCHKAFAIE
ncbi:MAG: hypothetical protein DRJ15_09020 [Bacteroidetes bacterium]|nr:MAG: hypothetical protein DRJ15_09020 [Bacteroidota bacterium]